MAATPQQVKKLIEDGFPGADARDIDYEGTRVVGTMRWAGFAGMDVRERNTLVTQKVRHALGLNSLNVGIIYPLAPGELLYD